MESDMDERKLSEHVYNRSHSIEMLRIFVSIWKGAEENFTRVSVTGIDSAQDDPGCGLLRWE